MSRLRRPHHHRHHHRQLSKAENYVNKYIFDYAGF